MPTFRISISSIDTGDLITTNNYSEAYREAIKIHPLTNTDEIIITEVESSMEERDDSL